MPAFAGERRDGQAEQVGTEPYGTRMCWLVSTTRSVRPLLQQNLNDEQDATTGLHELERTRDSLVEHDNLRVDGSHNSLPAPLLRPVLEDEL